METKTRTEYSARNTSVALLSRLTAIAMGYLLRVVFTHTLSESYVGVNGLFTDIIQVLSLSEMGIGTAITFALYRPIAEGDVEKQKSLMQLFKKFYNAVAVIVAVAGCALIPFMDVFIKDYENVEHLTLIYVLYLINTICSYLLIYKKTLMDAHQLLYIGTFYQTMSWVVQDVLQIIVLVWNHDFMMFLLINIATTVLCNVAISVRANKLYPYLKEKKAAPLPEEERKGIFANIRAMLMHKIGTVIVNNTDNLLLSAFVGLASVGSYSNYYLVIGSIRQMLNQVYQGITASVGNLGVTEDEGHIREVFEAVFFIGQWMYGFAFICLYELLNPFIEISFGEQYVFPEAIVFVLCLNFFMNGMRNATLTFRDSMGLFWYDRHKAIVEAVLNLVISLLFVHSMGVVGVFLGTLFSMALTSLWVEPYVLYKHGFHKSCISYFIRYFIYVAVIGAGWYATDLLCRGLVALSIISPWPTLILRLIICLVIPNLWFLVVYGRTSEFRFLMGKADSLLKKWGRKHSEKQEHTRGSKMKKTEKLLLEHLKWALNPEDKSIRMVEKAENTAESMKMAEKAGNTIKEKESGSISTVGKTGEHTGDDAVREIIEIAKKHAVLPFLYDVYEDDESLSDELKQMLRQSAATTARSNYRLLFLTKYITQIMEKQGIRAIILKGAATSSYYPVPELRKSGDIDILIPEEDSYYRAVEILKGEGFAEREDQPALHHIELRNNEGISVEVHRILAEPFESKRTNQYLETLLPEYKEHVMVNDTWGFALYQPEDAYHAFYLVLHMLQHFLRAGFGLKFLCDWVVFWNREVAEEEKKTFMRLNKESGTEGYVAVLTKSCVKYLGLREECVSFLMDETVSDEMVDDFMEEVFTAGEFGHDTNRRMVAMRGTGIGAYVREFHHQMHLNYPKAGKVFLFWPALWTLTLVRFLHNNRKVRNVKGLDVLKEAGKRSKLIDKMKLFR